MALQRRQVPDASHQAHSRARIELHRTLVAAAERELERALVEQRRPAIGMYMHPSRAEYAAFDRAVAEICAEAHRLDLRAEELIVGIKQAWSELITVRARHLGDRDGEVLRSVVSTSIDVFFQARDASDREGT